jgi:hypothetical protein
MQDCQGNQLKVGDRVRFFGSGGGMCHYETDPIKRLRAFGVIVRIDEAPGRPGVADIRVGQAKRVWQRFSSAILKRV